MHLDLFLYLSVCLASARLVLPELKKKNALRRSAASTRFLASLQADEELEPVGKAVWTACSHTGSLHITVVMVTEEPRHQRPRRRYRSTCYSLNLSLPNFWHRPHAFFKGCCLQDVMRSQSPFPYKCEDLIDGEKPSPSALLASLLKLKLSEPSQFFLQDCGWSYLCSQLVHWPHEIARTRRPLLFGPTLEKRRTTRGVI